MSLINKKEKEKFTIKNISTKNTEDIVNLTKVSNDFNHLYMDLDNINTVKKKIGVINEKKNNLWKGLFLKDDLIAHIQVILKNSHLIINPMVVKNGYENVKMINDLGNEIFKDINLTGHNTPKTFIAFIDSDDNLSMKILRHHKFKEVGDTPLYDLIKNFVIYVRIAKNHKNIEITPHPKLKEEVMSLLAKINLNRTIAEIKLMSYIFINNNPAHFRFIGSGDDNIKKYEIYKNKIYVGKYFEKKNINSWYNLILSNKISLELKDLVLKTLKNRFNANTSITSFSIIVDVNDYKVQEILLKLNFKFHAYLPLYFTENDGILFGISKIR